MPIFEIETNQGVFEIDADREPTQAEALQAISGQSTPSAAIDTSSVPRGGIGVPVSRDEARRISAQRLVAREREAGFRPGDLLLRSEAQQLANQAGIPVGNIGEVVSTSQFGDSPLGRALQAGVGIREAANQALFGVPGAVQSSLEDLIMNEAQKRVLGSQSLKERAPDVAIAGGTIGQLLPTRLVGGALTSAAPLTQRLLRGSGVGAGIGGLVSGAGAIEEGGLDTDIQTLLERAGIGAGLGGLFGGAFPAATAAAGRIGSGLRESAEKSVAQALLAGGGTKEAKAITERLTPEILARPMRETFALTRKGLAEKSGAQRELSGEAVGSFEGLQGSEKTKPILDFMDNLKVSQNHIVEGKVINPEAVQNIDEVKQLISQYGDSISRDGLQKLKKNFDTQTYGTKGAFPTYREKDLLNYKKIASDEIRGILAESNPDLAKLNRQYNFWSNLNDVATETSKRTKPQMGFVPTIATVAGAASGTGFADIAVRAVLFRGVAQATRSPGWKLISARIKNNIAKGLIDSDPQAAVSALKSYNSTLGSRVGSEIEQVMQAAKDDDINTLSQFSEGFIEEQPTIQ